MKDAARAEAIQDRNALAATKEKTQENQASNDQLGRGAVDAPRSNGIYSNQNPSRVLEARERHQTSSRVVEVLEGLGARPLRRRPQEMT